MGDNLHITTVNNPSEDEAKKEAVTHYDMATGYPQTTLNDRTSILNHTKKPLEKL